MLVDRRKPFYDTRNKLSIKINLIKIPDNCVLSACCRASKRFNGSTGVRQRVHGRVTGISGRVSDLLTQ